MSEEEHNVHISMSSHQLKATEMACRIPTHWVGAWVPAWTFIGLSEGSSSFFTGWTSLPV